MIKLVGVEKALGGEPVLRGVNLTIPVGKLTTIIGRSGEGKSVLLRHMIGLMQPDRGDVWVDGLEISRLKGKRLNQVRERFAMVFQGAALFDSLTSRKARCTLRSFPALTAASTSRRAMP